MVSVKQIRSIKQILSTKDYIVLDTETTGLSSDKDRIIEIGMVRVVNDEAVNHNGTFINPERPISASASNVNGITAADVQRAPTYVQIAPSIASLLIGTTVVAHNADFDMRFICRMLSEAGFDGEIQVIDTLRLARELIPELPNHKQGTLCEYFGIDPGRAHRAVDDALACYQILMRCKELAASSLLLSAKTPPHKSTVKDTAHVNKPSDAKAADRSYTNKIYTPSKFITRSIKAGIRPGDTLTLRKEPSNKYDKHAVAVYWKHHQIGYLYDNGLRDMVVDAWSKKLPVELSFVKFSSSKNDESATVDFRFFSSNSASDRTSNTSDDKFTFSSLLKKLPIWVWLIIALLLIGSCNNHRKDSLETVPAPTPISDTAPSSPTSEAVFESTYNPDYLVFSLSSDEPGEYGEWITLNAGTIDEYSYLAFHIPAGRYSVSNPSSKVAVQLTICQDGTAISSSGYEELIPADGVRPLVLMQGESGEIAVSPGQYIKLTDDSPGIWFERLERLK